MLDSGELVIHKEYILFLFLRTVFRASMVSAVSPLCESVIKSVPSIRIGFLYLYSLATSTLHGILAISSNQYFATIPAL